MKCEQCGTEIKRYDDARIHETGPGWAVHSIERCLRVQLAEVTRERDHAVFSVDRLNADNKRLREAVIAYIPHHPCDCQLLQNIEAALAATRGPDGKVKP